MGQILLAHMHILYVCSLVIIYLVTVVQLITKVMTLFATFIGLFMIQFGNCCSANNKSYDIVCNIYWMAFYMYGTCSKGFIIQRTEKM